jgi:AraC-like DNA-binding protein
MTEVIRERAVRAGIDLAERVIQVHPVNAGERCSPAALCRATLPAPLLTALACEDLQRLADAACTSARTLARRFQQEMAAPFSHWRMQLRLARLVQLWAEGHSLGESAAAVGYASPSALSYSVRRLLGMTPSCLLDQRQRGHADTRGAGGRFNTADQPRNVVPRHLASRDEADERSVIAPFGFRDYWASDFHDERA